MKFTIDDIHEGDVVRLHRGNSLWYIGDIKNHHGKYIPLINTENLSIFDSVRLNKIANVFGTRE